jgi:hypothetical protein
MLSRHLLFTAILTLSLSLASLAQVTTQPPATAPPATGAAAVAQPEPSPASEIDTAFVQKQFGSEFRFEPKYPVLKSDFDGDGVEDIAIVARAKNPMVDEAEHKYRVLDPYYGFYGTGDPRITTSFGSDDPEAKGLVVCIIHGSGAEAWRATDAKAKFVIVNLPFKQVAVKRIQIKKKLVNAIYAEVSSTIQDSSVIFFDGKKYKYQPMGSELQ